MLVPPNAKAIPAAAHVRDLCRTAIPIPVAATTIKKAVQSAFSIRASLLGGSGYPRAVNDLAEPAQVSWLRRLVPTNYPLKPTSQEPLRLAMSRGRIHNAFCPTGW